MKTVQKNIITKVLAIMMIALMLATTINVNQVYAATIKKSGVTLIVGSTQTLKTGVTGKTTWNSSKKDITTVDKNGKIKGIKAGKSTITAQTEKNTTYTWVVTVKNQDAQATSITISTVGGGDFYPEINTSEIKFLLDKKSTAIKVDILNDDDAVVYSKTLTSVSTKETSLTWDGKNSKGSFVDEGLYKVRITAGAIRTVSTDYFKVYVKNPFNGGVGSEISPYEVNTIEQFKLVGQFNGRYFKQTTDFDFEYATVKSLFTNDQPFTGSYNGNGKKISNITLEAPLFTKIIETGKLTNIILENGTLTTKQDSSSLLVGTNNGTIEKTNIINGSITGDSRNGLLVSENAGTIRNCEVSGIVKSNSSSPSGQEGAGSGGIASINLTNGKILSCNSTANVSDNFTKTNSSYAGGITAVNQGLISDSTASGTVENTSTSIWVEKRNFAGGICGHNTGKIQGSSYSGSSGIELAGKNEGIVQ